MRRGSRGVAVRRMPILLVLAGLALGTPAQGLAADTQSFTAPTEYRPRDIVLLVDSSTSMDDIFPAVREALQGFVEQARLGDSIAIVSFSDQPRVVEQRVIHGGQDRAVLQRSLERLSPAGRYTNITASLHRSVRLLRLRQLDAGAEGRVRFVVLLSDGRHNPPGRQPASAPETSSEGALAPSSGKAAFDEWRAAPTFAEVLDMYGDFRPGKDWFVHYVALRDDADAETAAFVRSARGQVSRVATGDLGRLIRVLDELTIPVEPRVRDLWGDAVLALPDGHSQTLVGPSPAPVAAVVATQHHGRVVLEIGDAVVVGMEPDSRVRLRAARYAPVTNTASVHLDLEAGSVCVLVQPAERRVVCALESRTAVVRVTGTALIARLTPGGSTETTVLEGRVQMAGPTGAHAKELAEGYALRSGVGGPAHEAAPLAPYARRLWTVWRPILRDRAPLTPTVASFATVAWSELSAHIGPIEPGHTYTEEVTVDLAELSGRAPAVSMQRVHLPEQIAVSATLDWPGPLVPAVVRLQVSAAPQWSPLGQREYSARIALNAGTVATSKEAASFPLIVSVRPPPTSVSTAQAAYVFVQDTFRRAPVTIWWSVLAVSLATPALLMLGKLWRENVAVELPMGRLLLTRNPVPDKWRRTVVDLEKLCRRHGVTEVSIGRSPDNLIALPDAAVLPRHARLIVQGRRQADRRLLLDLCPDAAVRVGEQLVRGGTVHLLDKMHVGFGGFEFAYEDTKHYEQVEVAMRDGRLIHGVLHSWDLTARGFSVSPEDDDMRQKDAAVVTIPFVEVEDIAVMSQRRRRRRRDRPQGYAADIRMRSGRAHTGKVRKDYQPSQMRFYFFPADRPDVDYMVIEWGAIQEIHVEGFDTVRVPRPDQRV